MESDLRIVCARPAKSFTAGHDASWSHFVAAMVELDAAAFMLQEGIGHEVVRRYLGKSLSEAGEKYLGLFGPAPRRNHIWRYTVQSSDIYCSRNATIAAQVDAAVKYPPDLRQWKPFNGALNYTHILWIDSDMTFSLEDVLRITSYEAPIVSGVAMVSPSQYHFGYFVTEDDIRTLLKLSGGQFVTPAVGKGMWYPSFLEEEIWRKYKPAKDGLIPVDFCGSAFLAVRRGVYEALPYPWYRTTLHDNYGRLVETSEDIGWCCRAKAAGFEIMIDPEVRVGHEKVIPLQAPTFDPKRPDAREMIAADAHGRMILETEPA